MNEPRRSRTFLLGAALLALVFVAGVAAGVIADRVMARRPFIVARLSGDMSGVLDRLGLTPQQRMQADSILSRRAPRSEALMIEVAERLHAVSDSADAELRAILTPEQRIRLDSLRLREPMMLLKRKMTTPGGRITVDTVLPLLRDSGRRR